MDWKLVVGLGNPGRKYERTRHNIGFRVIDVLKQALEPVKKKKGAAATVFEGEQENRAFLLALPATFMNRSGEAVKSLAADYGLEWPHNCLVVSDDCELLLGKIRMREKGSAGGHRGLESIIQVCGSSAFHRLRIGVGRPADPAVALESYVLEDFSREEEALLPEILERAASAVLLWAESGSQAVMNRFN